MGRNRGNSNKRRGRDTGGEYLSREQMLALDNAQFTRQYRGTIIPEPEWDAFMAAMRTGLPSCFRVNGALPGAALVRTMVQQALGVERIQPVLFVPRGLAFQTGESRGSLKRDEKFKAAKRLVHVLNDEGFLSRQEAVSMIPPVLLDVQPGHRVIDMCAAPGSKTTQILESLVAGGEGGVVIANDLNQGRLDVLNHQTARLPNAKSRLIVTNHDAMAFPLVMKAEHKFDRVLCDVMCSGDGTLRKSLDLWGRWTALAGPNLHVQQARVLMRGMGLCKQGGIVVYSTCSLNPIEDEAVIARCLQEAGGRFELIEPDPALAQLKRYPGRHEWQVLSPNATEVLSPPPPGESGVTVDRRTSVAAPDEEQPDEGAAPAPESGEAERPKRGRGGVRAAAKARFTFGASMFPPTPEVAASLKLERCVRVAPHLQDTGGFFIAAMRCVEELPNSVSTSFKAKYVPTFVPLSEERVAALKQAVPELPPAFPFHRLFSQGETSRNPKVYYATEDCAAYAGSCLNAKVVQLGVKVFESHVRHSWTNLRFVPDGAATIAPHVGEALQLRTTAEVLVEYFESDAVETTNIPIEDVIAHSEPRRFHDVPPTVPSCGLLAVECGAALGTVHIPFSRSSSDSSLTVRTTKTQSGVVWVAAGKPLAIGGNAAAADDDSNGSDLEEQAAPGQPSAESK